MVVLTVPLLQTSKNPGLVKWLAFATIIQVALGTITAAADIWLHLTSTTQPWGTVSPLQTVSTSYSRTLFENCTSGEFVYKGEDIEPNDPYQGGRYSCATWSSASAIWLNGIVEGLHTVNNLSTINTIYQSSDGIAFLGPAQPLSGVDFQATSSGIRSTCTPISTVCQLGLDEIGAATPYDCGNISRCFW